MVESQNQKVVNKPSTHTVMMMMVMTMVMVMMMVMTMVMVMMLMMVMMMMEKTHKTVPRDDDQNCAVWASPNSGRPQQWTKLH